MSNLHSLPAVLDPSVTVAVRSPSHAALPRMSLRQIGTKIICTLGPATSSVEAISELIQAGATIFRLNFSHGTHQAHSDVLKNVRTAAQQVGMPVAILQDLCGPKIRISHVAGNQPVTLVAGQVVCLTTSAIFKKSDGQLPQMQLATNYAAILDDVQVGEPILINDGKVRLQVTKRYRDYLQTQVVQGGQVSLGKGINLPQAKLSTPSVTEKDWKDLAWGLANGVDFVALSFVRTANDLIQVRDHLDRAGSVAQLIAKIERPEALGNIESILEWCDGIMIARGDLALETDFSQVPLVQKELIRSCRQRNKPVITATQMLDSMVDNAMPTRAEVSDIANAVLDGTDAVMLSNESAVGQYPTLAVQTLAKVSHSTEGLSTKRFAEDELPASSRTAAMAQSASVLAQRCGAVAVAVYTQSGFAARHLSSLRMACPVIACTNVEQTQRQLNLSYGVNSLLLDQFMSRTQFVQYLTLAGLKNKWWKAGDQFVVVCSSDGSSGDMNTLQIVTVESHF